MAVAPPNPRPVQTVSVYLSRLRRLKATEGTVFLYRGHSDSAFQIRSSITRDPSGSANESLFIREFVNAFPNEFSGDETTLEKLVRAQHYNIPTRLLDLTWNPLVSLYFSVNQFDGTDSEVLIFTVDRERIKYYDSDSVSILANMSNLSKEDKGELRPLFRSKLPTADKLHSTNAVKRLMHFIRAEKPHVTPNIEPRHLTQTIFVQPKLNNRSILAQNGAFALVGLKHIPSSSGGFSLTRIAIDGKSKPSIRRELHMLGIHRSSLFPEIENAADFIKERLGLTTAS